VRLSSDLSQKFGKGFSPTNLKMMRLFYQSFPIRQTMSDKSQKSKLKSDKSMLDSQKTITEFEPVLSWSYYCELLKNKYQKC